MGNEIILVNPKNLEEIKESISKGDIK